MADSKLMKKIYSLIPIYEHEFVSQSEGEKIVIEVLIDIVEKLERLERRGEGVANDER